MQQQEFVVLKHKQDIDRFMERLPGVRVGGFSGDWGFGAGFVHIGGSVVSHLDLDMLIGHWSVPNQPLGGNPPKLEALFLTITREDVRALIEQLTAWAEQMDAQK